MRAHPSELQQLHAKLDFAYSTPPEFDVDEAVVFARILLCLILDLLMNLAHRLQQAEVQIRTKHKRQYEGRQFFRGEHMRTAVQPQNPCFEPSKTLPRSRILLEISLQSCQGQSAHARTPEGSQGQVDAKDKAMLIDLGNELRHFSRPLQKILLVGDGLRAHVVALSAGLAILFIHIDEIDVARDIELFGTELAHGDHPNVRLSPEGVLRQTP